jgi:Ni/Co efflux regulator RcnB
MVLPTIFWRRNYWISDYWMFGLMNPPYGYVWVRYGEDALLVNVQTGRILQVVYSVFY